MHQLIDDGSSGVHQRQSKLMRWGNPFAALVITYACLILGVSEVRAEEPAQSGATVTASEATGKSLSVEPRNSTKSEEAVSENEVLGLSWITQQPRNHYTVQLMVAASPQHLVAYIRKESLVAPLAIAGFRKNGKVLHLLLHGSYATREEAEVAARQFESAKGLHPWVRGFAALPELIDSQTATAAEVKAEAAKEPLPTVAGAAWVWSRNPLHYTVQVMADSRKDRLNAFVKRHRPAGPLAIVRVGRNGKAWYLLLAGDYASEEAGAKASRELPNNLSAGHPQVRRFAALHDQMVAANH